MRLIPPPKGLGRWQVWKTAPGKPYCVGRYRTRLNAVIIAELLNELAERDWWPAVFEVRRGPRRAWIARLFGRCDRG